MDERARAAQGWFPLAASTSFSLVTERKRELDDLRRQMAELDIEFLRVLEKRARMAKQIGSLRGAGTVSLPAHDLEHLHALGAMLQEDLPRSMALSVLREVHAATLALEQPIRVAYVGPEGSAGELAALRELGPLSQRIAVEGAAEAFDEVKRQRADYAVVPCESSTEGPNQATIVALTSSELTLVAMTEIPVVLSLMSKTGNVGDVEKVYAQVADRTAAQRYLRATLPKISVVDVRSPSFACQLAVEDHGAAALVPEATGEAAELAIIQSNVGDQADLRIRFGLASMRPTSRTGADTTAFVFSVHDQPGALFEALQDFAERGLNLRTIHSRPMPGEKWSYLFYVEVSGHVSDRPVVQALEAVKRKTRFLKVLGSYPSL